MKKIVIFGNSGSGKSTLAKKIRDSDDLPHLDLDSIAWQATSPPERKPIAESKTEIEIFIDSNPGWVIEGRIYRTSIKLTFLPQWVNLCNHDKSPI